MGESTDLSSSMVILNPEKEIDDAIERNDWFSAFAISVSFFEYYGTRRITDHCTSKNIVGCRDTVKRMGVGNIIFILRILNFIDDDLYSKMRKTITERNKIVHPSRGGVAYRFEKQETRAIELLKDAKECIHKIK